MKDYIKIQSNAIMHLRSALNKAESNECGEALDEAELAVTELTNFCDWRTKK